jgi:L-ascorbate metabolism protein UlaG (beta-lactamase superfamily)
MMKSAGMLFIIFSILVSTAGCEEEATNTSPVISSFQADVASVDPNGQATLVVSATDAEDDTLTYTYQLTGGTITGTGNTVTWVAPETAGSYTINVDVSDGKLNAQSTVEITVAAAQQEKPKEETKEENTMELKIQWFGHSCFLITSTDGKRVLTDPFNASVGYPVPSVETEVVLVSHSHGDHNNTAAAKGNPQIVRTEGESSAAGMSFLGVSSFHDNSGGSQRGKNIIFVWEMDSVRLAHLGDLGQQELTADQVAEIGKVDLIFIPVGGNYTIDAKQATKVMEQLSPKLVFPMHYKTDVANLPIASVDGFLAGKDNVEKVGKNSVVVEELPEKTKVVVLDYK